MKLENGYKLIYEVVKDGVREFRASKTGIPADDDFVLTSNEIGSNKLIYQYDNKFYGTDDNFIPTYNEDGTPADAKLITDEDFAKVFVAGGYTEAGDEPEAANEVTNETPVEVEEPVAPVTEPDTNEGDEEPPVEEPTE